MVVRVACHFSNDFYSVINKTITIWLNIWLVCSPTSYVPSRYVAMEYRRETKRNTDVMSLLDKYGYTVIITDPN